MAKGTPWGQLTEVGGQHEMTFRGPMLHDPEIDVPHIQAATNSLARQVDAAKAELRAASRDIQFEPPPDATPNRPAGTERAREPRSRRLVAFMGANELSRAATEPPPQRAPNRAPVNP